jgi:hypothetical protein
VTELEAKQFIEELIKLSSTYERLGKCQIEINVSEKRMPAKKIRWLVIDKISLKVD